MYIFVLVQSSVALVLKTHVASLLGEEGIGSLDKLSSLFFYR